MGRPNPHRRVDRNEDSETPPSGCGVPRSHVTMRSPAPTFGQLPGHPVGRCPAQAGPQMIKTPISVAVYFLRNDEQGWVQWQVASRRTLTGSSQGPLHRQTSENGSSEGSAVGRCFGDFRHPNISALCGQAGPRPTNESCKVQVVLSVLKTEQAHFIHIPLGPESPLAFLTVPSF